MVKKKRYKYKIKQMQLARKVIKKDKSIYQCVL